MRITKQLGIVWQLVVAATIGIVAVSSDAAACPFCNSVSQSLRQEMESVDTVAFGTILPGTETDTDATFLVHTVLRGDDILKVGQQIKVNYFGNAKSGQHFLLMGVDPPDLLWSSPLPVSYVAMNYIDSISKLPEDSLAQLEFYLGFLEHSEPLLARDAYDEFAPAAYSLIKQLKPQMNRKQLLTWIQDTSLPPDRKRLYLVMLGVCGEKGDADLLESMMRSDDRNKRAGLDAMIACYATLKGEEGLELIDELFLANEKSEYADTYAAIMAMRFHGTDGGIIDKGRILESMRLILDRPALADLVIRDLARWEDWTQIDKLVGLFKNADDDTSWVRVPVINYLRACPLDRAAKELEALKEIDPAAYKRATSFFPIPRSNESSTDSSSMIDPSVSRGLAATDRRVSLREGLKLATAQTGASVPAGVVVPLAASTSLAPNRAALVGVVCMASTTLWMAMWLSISGAGSNGIVTGILRRLE